MTLDFWKSIVPIMKVIHLSILAAFCCLLSACSSTGQDVTQTPLGSVITGETKDADGYLDRVRQQNAANTRASGVNQTDYESHEHTNFGTSEKRY